MKRFAKLFLILAVFFYAVSVIARVFNDDLPSSLFCAAVAGIFTGRWVMYVYNQK